MSHDDVFDQLNDNLNHAINNLNEAAKTQFNSQGILVDDVTNALNKLYEHIKDPYAHGIADPNSLLRKIVVDEATKTATDVGSKAAKDTIDVELPLAIDRLLPPAVESQVSDAVNKKVPEKIAEILPDEVAKQTAAEIAKQLPPAIESQVTDAVNKKVPEKIAEILPDEVNKKINELLPDAVDKEVTKQTTNKINELLPDEVKNQVAQEVDKRVPTSIKQNLPSILEQELNDRDSYLMEVFEERVTTIVQDKIDSGEISGGVGGPSGVILITTPVITHPDLLIIGATNSCSVTARSKLEDSYVESFTIAAGGKSWEVKATNNAASFSVAVPAGTATGTAFAISVVAKDNLGSYSEMATVTPKTSTASVTKPNLISPANNALIGLSSCEMIVSDFTTIGTIDTQSAVQFQALNTSGAVVYDSGEITDSSKFKSNTLKLPSNTVKNTTFSIRVRQKGKSLGWSSWSDTVTVKTTSDYVSLLGTRGRIMMYSSDGINIDKPVVQDEVSTEWFIGDVIGDANGKVFVTTYKKDKDDTYNGVYFTSDGLNYTKTNLNLGETNVKIRKHGSGFIAFKDINIYKSDDGVSWILMGKMNHPVAYTLRDLMYIEKTNTYVGLFYISSNNYTVKYSVGNIASFTNDLKDSSGANPIGLLSDTYTFSFQFKSGNIAIGSGSTSSKVYNIYISEDGQSYTKVSVTDQGGDNSSLVMLNTVTNNVLKLQGNAIAFHRYDYYEPYHYYYIRILRDGQKTSPTEIRLQMVRSSHASDYSIRFFYSRVRDLFYNSYNNSLLFSTYYSGYNISGEYKSTIIVNSDNTFSEAHGEYIPYHTYRTNTNSIYQTQIELIYEINGRVILTMNRGTFDLGKTYTAQSMRYPLTPKIQIKKSESDDLYDKDLSYYLREGYKSYLLPTNMYGGNASYAYFTSNDGNNFTENKLPTNVSTLAPCSEIIKAFDQYIWKTVYDGSVGRKTFARSNDPVINGMRDSNLEADGEYGSIYYTGKNLICGYTKTSSSYTYIYLYYRTGLSGSWTSSSHNFTYSGSSNGHHSGFRIVTNGSGTVWAISPAIGYAISTNHGVSYSNVVYFSNKVDSDLYNVSYGSTAYSPVGGFYLNGYWGFFASLKSNRYYYNLFLSKDLDTWNVVDFYNFSSRTIVNVYADPVLTSDKRLLFADFRGSTVFIVNPATRAIEHKCVPGGTYVVQSLSTYS